MLWVPQKGKVLVQHNAGSTGNTQYGTFVTAGSTSSTKGTPSQIIASTSFDAYFIVIEAREYGVSNTASRGLLDVLIGTPTEEVIIPNLMVGNCGQAGSSSAQGAKVWSFPLYIPAGAEISAQMAGDRVDPAATFLSIYIMGGHAVPNFRVGSKVTTYGIGTLPAGTAFTPGASTAEGSFTEITSGTSEDHFAFMPSWQHGGADTAWGNRHMTIDIGIGAATESVLPLPWNYGIDSNERAGGPFVPFCAFQDVPSGTRLALRGSMHSTLEGGTYEAAIHAVS